jgi:hypothetical protein
MTAAAAEPGAPSAAATAQTRSDERRAAARDISPASLRTRRWRQLTAKGQKIALTPYDDDIVGLLLDLGWLKLEKSEDSREIGLAIFAMLKDAAAKRDA